MTKNRQSRYRHVDWRDHLIGLALCVSYVILLLGSSSNLGMSRDEGFYVIAADRYGAWFELLLDDPSAAIQQESVDEYWAYNHEHPSLVKSSFAFFHLADEAWGLFEEPSTGYRFFGMLCGGLLLWLIFIFGARAYGRQVGAFAAIAFALIPRVFYHCQLDCFDMPIVFMLMWVTYCYWRSLSNPWWALMTGFAYGCALATKHNAWVLPGVCLIHWGFVVASEISRRRAGLGSRVSLVPWWFIAMVLMGPPIFVYSWPWMWFDTVTRFGEYAGFHINHVHYNMAYLGETYFQPPLPISYPWLMTLFTVPLATLCLTVGGIWARRKAIVPGVIARRIWPEEQIRFDASRTDILIFGSMLAPLVVISLPSTPIFGGTKHWITGYPYFAIFAGVSFISVARVARAFVRDRLPYARYFTRLGVALLLLGPGLVETVHSHPFALSHYTAAAGGVAGAADHGMNRQFWGFTTGSLTEFFNEHLPEGGSVWPCDTTVTAWQMLQRDGELSPNIRVTGHLPSADYAIVHHEDHFAEVDFQIWEIFGTVQPDYVLTYDGVPIVSVYRNPRSRRAVPTQITSAETSP